MKKTCFLNNYSAADDMDGMDREKNKNPCYPASSAAERWLPEVSSGGKFTVFGTEEGNRDLQAECLLYLVDIIQLFPGEEFYGDVLVAFVA